MRLPSEGLAYPPPVTSTFAPLRRPVFRMLWATWITANTCMWMNDVAAAWMMTSLSASPAMVALVQTASTLPVFLLGLPSGALADILDRRRWFMATQIWVAIVGVVLSLVVLAGAMTPALLLALTFANGVGLAMRWPVFAAIVPELVPRDELPQALGLNSIAMNASRIIGPVLAGALIAGAGSAYVFALNAALSMASAIVIWLWRRDAAPASVLPGERFVGAMRVGVQYVRQSPRMRAVLARAFLFFLQANALLALLPLVAQRVHGGGAGAFTLMLASMGAGAIAAALLLPRLRSSATRREPLVRAGTVVLALAMALVALVPNLWVALPAMLIGGMAWITVANTLTMSAQLALPDWVRARGMSIYQMALMGGSAAGAALWALAQSLFAGRSNAWDFVQDDNTPLDGDGHGTHVAGTIAADNIEHNNVNLTGVAYNATIMPVRVLDDNGNGTNADVAAGIRYAVDNGADVINLSLGGGYSSEMESALQYAAAQNVVVVMAAGNESASQPGFPANLANQLGVAVGAVDSTNRMANFSNKAGISALNYIVAPGVNIYSTTPGNTYNSFNGTSMATPHVAGVAALMLSASPNLTAAEVERILRETANPTGITV